MGGYGFPDSESWITKVLKGFFEMEISAHRAGVWGLGVSIHALRNMCLEKRQINLWGRESLSFLEDPLFCFINNGYQRSRGMRSKGSICLCPDSLPGSSDGMSLLYFSNSVCL